MLKLGGQKRSTDSGRALRRLALWVFVLLVFGLAAGNAAKATENPAGPVTSAGPGPQFTIADFDGDHRPDLASIQPGQSAAGTSSYSIQLQLSTAGRQSIQIAAPSGGLFIEARDVNGDHAVDLVLTTAWFRQPVAILLNDGHGGFSRVEPSAFPKAFSEPTDHWNSGSDPATDAVGVPPQSRAGHCAETRVLVAIQSHADPILLSNAKFALDSFLISHAGRAPPSELPRF